ncbi:hypothetical protein DPMN_012642 [Dreissena polymorpha]|uniref:Uncharacterized protein n=1 Tax=Dreissena polymorpha TaxID=45954 RepID=A0A9D4N7E4_DREPO|nr:hypothetical protein DPMN_012642 [Dreissena polymorpha]
MVTTRDLCSLYLVGKMMDLLVHNLLNLAIAEIAMVIHKRNSAVGQECYQLLEAGHVFQLILVRGDFLNEVDRAVHHALLLLRDGLHPLC